MKLKCMMILAAFSLMAQAALAMDTNTYRLGVFKTFRSNLVEVATKQDQVKLTYAQVAPILASIVARREVSLRRIELIVSRDEAMRSVYESSKTNHVADRSELRAKLVTLVKGKEKEDADIKVMFEQRKSELAAAAEKDGGASLKKLIKQMEALDALEAHFKDGVDLPDISEPK